MDIEKIDTEDVLKFKRQIRDYFNKNIHDLIALTLVADTIGYKRKEAVENVVHSTVPIPWKG